MSSVTHLTGPAITVEGRYMRQRCSWCGTAIIEEDLSLIAVPSEHPGPIPSWPAGSWVEVDEEEGGPTIYRLTDAEDGRIPVGACTRDVIPVVRAVGDRKP